MVCRNYSQRIRPKQKPASRKKKHPFRWLALLMMGVLAALHLSMRSTVGRAIRYQGRLLGTELLAEETLALLEEKPLGYGDLVQIAQDEGGRILSVETNAGEVGRLKAALERNVSHSLEDLHDRWYSLPLGTLLGSEWLAGRGPDIPFRLAPMGYLDSTVESRFASAGINQTSHQITLNLTLELNAMIPLHREPVTVHTNFIIAETILVGEIPQYYTSITTPQSELSSYLADQRIDPWDAE